MSARESRLGAPGQDTRHDLLFCITCCIALLSVIVVASATAALVPVSAFGPTFFQPVAAHSHFVDRFFVWDSGWYDYIAKFGYKWNPADQAQQTVAFFPLWPLVLRTIYAVFGAGQAGRTVVIALTTSLACASIFAFHRLAGRMLSMSARRWATALYALNPAANFMLQSYPVGLINLLTIVSLIGILERRYWQSAILGGIATAAGPLAVFLSLVVLLAAAGEDRWAWITHRSRAGMAWSMLNFSAMGVVALSGILGFMLWLQWRFHSPLAFVSSQDAWIKPLPFVQRVWIFVKSELILRDFQQAATATMQTVTLLRAGNGAAAETSLQSALAHCGLGLSLIGALFAFMLRPRWIACYGWLVMAAYLWIIETNLGGYATLRLIYMAVPGFLGLGLLLHRIPLLAGLALVLAAAALALEEMLTCWGYWVI